MLRVAVTVVSYTKTNLPAITDFATYPPCISIPSPVIVDAVYTRGKDGMLNKIVIYYQLVILLMDSKTPGNAF